MDTLLERLEVRSLTPILLETDLFHLATIALTLSNLEGEETFEASMLGAGLFHSTQAVLRSHAHHMLVLQRKKLSRSESAMMN